MSRIGLNCTLLTPNPTETILDFILYTSYQLFLLPLILYSVESLSFFLMLLLTILQYNMLSSVSCEPPRCLVGKPPAACLSGTCRHSDLLLSKYLQWCVPSGPGNKFGFASPCTLSQIASHTVLLRSLTALWGTANILPANHLTATPVAMIQTAYWSSKWATEWGRQVT